MEAYGNGTIRFPGEQVPWRTPVISVNKEIYVNLCKLWIQNKFRILSYRTSCGQDVVRTNWRSLIFGRYCTQRYRCRRLDCIGMWLGSFRCMRDTLALQWWSRPVQPSTLEMGDRKWVRIALAAVDLGSASYFVGRSRCSANCFAGRSRCSAGMDFVNRIRGFGLDFGTDSAGQSHYSRTDSVGWSRCLDSADLDWQTDCSDWNRWTEEQQSSIRKRLKLNNTKSLFINLFSALKTKRISPKINDKLENAMFDWMSADVRRQIDSTKLN